MRDDWRNIPINSLSFAPGFERNCGAFGGQARAIPFGYFWPALSSLKMVTSSLQANLHFTFVFSSSEWTGRAGERTTGCGVLGSLLAFF